MNEQSSAGEKNIGIKSGEGSQPLLSSDFIAFISGIIPNTKYFDSRFDYIQVQIDELRRLNDITREQITKLDSATERRFEQVDKRFEQADENLKDFKKDVDRRFGQVDENLKGFKNDVDKRFEQVDKRFEQVDRRFEQMIASIDRLGDKLDNRDKDQRNFTLKMFGVAIAVSVFGVLGAFLKMLGIF